MEKTTESPKTKIDWYAWKLEHCKDYPEVIKRLTHPYVNPAYAEANPSHPIMESYYIPMPSSNPVIRFLDWYCSLDNGFNNHAGVTVLIWLISQLGGWVIPFIVGMLRNDFEGLFLCICDISIAIWGIAYICIAIVFRIDLIYRHYRNKYIAKHNLPGPYGWGSIDRTSHERLWLLYELFGYQG